MVTTIADENVGASLQFHINWLILLQVTLDVAKGLNKMEVSKHMLFLLLVTTAYKFQINVN